MEKDGLNVLGGLIRRRLRSFRYAGAGIWHSLRTQENMWIHALATVLVFLFGWGLGVSRVEMGVLVLAVVAVWGMELMNTAVEAVVDLVMPERHPLAKVAKDAAAGAVLVTAVGAAVVGFLILGPPLWEFLIGRL
ncbi:MAG TPA: diacylglycerol kinase family protein [Anaerolineae bacterium]|nr:diacylglycerol kinase family protein [Anaerolineae bacterium]